MKERNEGAREGVMEERRKKGKKREKRKKEKPNIHLYSHVGTQDVVTLVHLMPLE